MVITSSLKLEDIEKVEKFRPDSLILRGGEDGKEPVFRVGASKKTGGAINKYGVTFASEAKDGSGLATLTLFLPKDIPDVKESLVDTYGDVFDNLAVLEEKMPDIIKDIDARREAIMNEITLA